MNKRFFLWLVFMLMLLVPFAAMADTDPIVVLGGVEMKPGDFLVEGATATQETIPDEGVGYAFLKEEDGSYVLTLNNYSTSKFFTYSTSPGLDYCVNLVVYQDLILNLTGDNALQINYSIDRYSHFGIALVNASLTITGDDTATLNITMPDDTISAFTALAISANDRSVTNANETLTINGGSISTNDTIMVYDFTMNNGTLSVLADNRGNAVYTYSKNQTKKMTIHEDYRVPAEDIRNENKFNVLGNPYSVNPTYVLKKPVAILGGVKMAAGDYLVEGADSTQKNMPDGNVGYAFLSKENGGYVLTLYNYTTTSSYTYESVPTSYSTKNHDAFLLVYRDLTLRLCGNNAFTYGGDLSGAEEHKDFYGVVLDTASLTVEGSPDSTLNITTPSGDRSFLSRNIANQQPVEGLTFKGGKTTTNNDILVHQFTMQDGVLDVGFHTSGSAILADTYNIHADYKVPDSDFGKYFTMGRNMLLLPKDNSGLTSYVLEKKTTPPDVPGNPGGGNDGENAGPGIPVPPDSPAADNASASVPTTGDDTPIALWAVLALASACAMVALRRRQLAK